MNHFTTGLILTVIGFLGLQGSATAQETDCERNALAADSCTAWQSAVQATSLSQTLGQIDSHLAALAGKGKIAPEKADAQRAKLATSQAAWQTFIERQCALPAAHPEGPDACRRQMTEVRLAELQNPDLPYKGSEDKSWSERRLLQSPFHTEAWVMLRIAGPPMRTIADRVALAKGPRETQDWTFKKWVSDFQKKIRAVSGFGPLTSGFIAAEWDMLRYHPETGVALHQAPGRIEGSPADITWDKNEAEAFAARLPACMRNMADPQCRVQYSTELGCRYDTAMAQFCQAKLDGLREVFQSYTVENPEHRDHFYKAVACLTPVPLDASFSGTFLTATSNPAAAIDTEGRPCSALGLVPDGNGWSARGGPVLGVALDLEIR